MSTLDEQRKPGYGLRSYLQTLETVQRLTGQDKSAEIDRIKNLLKDPKYADN